MKNVRPIAACILLLLPLVYLGSYCAMVTPGRWVVFAPDSFGRSITQPRDYRFGEDWAKRIYWPLEQVDRKVFPNRWVTAWQRAKFEAEKVSNRSTKFASID